VNISRIASCLLCATTLQWTHGQDESSGKSDAAEAADSGEKYVSIGRLPSSPSRDRCIKALVGARFT